MRAKNRHYSGGCFGSLDERSKCGSRALRDWLTGDISMPVVRKWNRWGSRDLKDPEGFRCGGAWNPYLMVRGDDFSSLIVTSTEWT